MNELSATAQRRSYTRTTNARIPEHVRAHSRGIRLTDLSPGHTRHPSHAHSRHVQLIRRDPCTNTRNKQTRKKHSEPTLTEKRPLAVPAPPPARTAASLHWRGPENPMKRSNVHTAREWQAKAPDQAAGHRRASTCEQAAHHQSRTYMHVHAHAHAATRPPGHQKWHF